jgi:hypothetical protein
MINFWRTKVKPTPPDDGRVRIRIKATDGEYLLVLPTGWGHVHWSVFTKLSDQLSIEDLLALLCDFHRPDLITDLIAVQLIQLFTFLSQLPEPAALIKPIDLYPLESYIGARDAIRNDPTNLFAAVRAYWPVCGDSVDDVIPKWLAIQEGWDKLHKAFEILNTPPNSLEVRAGIKRLEPFGEYNMVAQLAGGDILKENAILQLETRHVFMHRAQTLVASEVEAKLAKLRMQQASKK